MTKRLLAVEEVLKTPEPEREDKAEELEQKDQTEPATSDEIEGTDGEPEQSIELTDEQTTEILNQFLNIVAQVLKGSPLQEQEVKDKEFGESIMDFLDAAGANSEQVEQIKTKLGEVELNLRVVDQALKADGAKEEALEALEALKQRLAQLNPRKHQHNLKKPLLRQHQKTTTSKNYQKQNFRENARSIY